MNERFSEAVQSLETAFDRLMSMPPTHICGISRNMPEKEGVYLLSCGSEHLYVGRSKRLFARLKSHCHDKRKGAPLAFALARERTDLEGKRKALLANSRFFSAYQKAKREISTMDLRFVEEKNSLRQILLEIYVAVALRTPHNDFDEPEDA
jgi:predicted GIY-YIG superfamily endonuclease